MKRLASVSLFALIVVGVLLSSAAPAHAWSRGGGWHHGGWHHGGPRFFVGFGPGYWGPYPYWYYPPPYYAYTPPVVVQEEPPVYVQQPAAASAAPAPPSAPAYWYYCASAQEYYPRVQTCTEAWVKVPPRQN